jgi:hypothetical protein
MTGLARLHTRTVGLRHKEIVRDIGMARGAGRAACEVGLVRDANAKEVVLEVELIVGLSHLIVTAQAVLCNTIRLGQKAATVAVIYDLSRLGVAIDTGNLVEAGVD